MEHVDLIASCERVESLGAFATDFFDAVEIADREERESSNYTGGTYFIGRRNGVEFNVSISDDPLHQDLPYWIQASTEAVDAEVLIAAIDRQVRERLLPHGFRVARILDFGETTERRLPY